jgi:hypothetical protein
LTTLQITQFVVGASFAFIHLVIAYQIPVSVPYLYNVAPKVVSMAASDASAVASTAIASASADAGALFKRFALRAAGYEGLAENVVGDSLLASSNYQAPPSRQQLASAENRYKEELQWVHCLDTSGQAFAILLNVLYLAPLTWLFVQFFIKSYLTHFERRRSSAAAEQARIAASSLGDASKGVARRLSQAVIDMHAAGDSSDTDSPIVESSESVNTLKEKAAANAEKTREAAQRSTNNLGKTVTDAQETISEKAKPVAEAAQKKVQEVATKVQEQLPSTEKIKEQVNVAVNTVKQESSAADDVKTKAQDTADKVGEKEAKEAQYTTQQEPRSKVTDDKSFAGATKEEVKDKPTSEASSIPAQSPNEDGTGAVEATGSTNNEDKAEKKAQDKIIDESQPVRDDDQETGDEGTNDESGAERPSSRGSASQIPRPKKKKNKNKNKKA